MNTETPDHFEERARQVLQDSAEHLDGATRSRLTQARHAALDAVRQKQSRPWLWLLPATGAAAAVILTFFVTLQSPDTPPTNFAQADVAQSGLAAVDEMDIITAEDSLDFYRDVEFYSWLDTQLEDEA